MEAFRFSIQLLYIVHITKALSLSGRRPFSFLYSCYIQLIQGRHSPCQNTGLPHKSCRRRDPRHVVDIYSQSSLGNVPNALDALGSGFDGRKRARAAWWRLVPGNNYPLQPSHGWDCFGGQLAHTIAIYNSCKEGTLLVRAEASFFSLQLLYTTHTRKAFFLSDWRPLSFLHSCYIQFIQKRLQTRFW